MSIIRAIVSWPIDVIMSVMTRAVMIVVPTIVIVCVISRAVIVVHPRPRMPIVSIVAIISWPGMSILTIAAVCAWSGIATIGVVTISTGAVTPWSVASRAISAITIAT